MHPLIAASLSTQLSRERVAPRPRHPRRVTTRGTPEPTLGELVIRRAGAADGAERMRLAELDGDRTAGELLARAAAHHDVLVAEVDGSIEAAYALDGGVSVADPFRPSARDAQLLALRARQLGGDAPRRSRGRLGVLHLRTS
jgi:hypothetical protein